MLMQERQRSTKLPNSDRIHLTRFRTCCKGTPERVVKNSCRGLRGSIFVGELLLSQWEISCLQLSCSPWWLETHEQQLASLVHLQSMVLLKEVYAVERIGAELPGWPRMAQVRCQKLLENASGKMWWCAAGSPERFCQSLPLAPVQSPPSGPLLLLLLLPLSPPTFSRSPVAGHPSCLCSG